MRALLLLIAVAMPASVHAQPAPASPPVYSITPGTRTDREGITFEANLGVAALWSSNEAADANDVQLALAGPSLGLGVWLADSLALSLRLAYATYSPAVGERLSAAFVGPTVQYWRDDHLWFGLGAGLAFEATSFSDGSESQTQTGYGGDTRIGYTLTGRSANTFNVSVELTSGFYETGGVYGFALLFGYQHL